MSTTEHTTAAQVVSEREAAARIGMSLSWLRQTRRLAAAGKPARLGPCPPHLRIGRAVRYSTADLEAWLRQRRVAM